MTKLLVQTALSATIMLALGAAAPASAQQDDAYGEEGLYLSLSAAADFPNSGEFDGVQAPDPGVPGASGDPASVSVDYETGFNVRGAVGYEFDRGVLFKNLVPRIEVEFEYGENDVSSGTFNGGNQTFGGDITRYAVKASFYNDIRWSKDQTFIPYFGTGLGIGVVDTNITYFPNNGIATAPTFAVSGSSTSFTTHSAIGATIKLGPQLELFGEGRYTDYRNGDFERIFVGDGSGGFNADLQGDTETFSLGAGIRYRF